MNQHLSSNNKHCWEIFKIFLYLGLIAFGGPIAHLSYFRDAFVVKRKWFSEQAYADLVALCQFLPGPASSQVGMGIGLSCAGIKGAITAWLGFTLPSALLLIAFAISLMHWQQAIPTGLLHGLEILAVAVIAQAILGMAKQLCTDVWRRSVAVLVCMMVLLVPMIWMPMVMIVLAGMASIFKYKTFPHLAHTALSIKVNPYVAVSFLSLFFGLLILIPVLAELTANSTLVFIDGFYRAGSLVFGGGHVVLPWLENAVVTPGWVDEQVFLAGYGAAQAVPGPLFTVAAFLGAAAQLQTPVWLNAVMALLAIFLPSFLLIVGALPFWEQLRSNIRMQAALCGINAAVVGILLAALYQPVWRTAIINPIDFALALFIFCALVYWRWPVWCMVIFSAISGSYLLN